MTPLVTTIIPVYNQQRYLADAIGSVLLQTGIPTEVWIVDDGSTDESSLVADRMIQQSTHIPMHLLRQPNLGAAAARNAGAAHGTGEFLAFLDADDLWTEGRLSAMLAAFTVDPSLQVVFGYVEQFISPELDEASRQKLICPTEPQPGYHPGGMVIRRSAFMKLGGFNDRWKRGEVVDWYARIREHQLHECLIPQVVFRRRLHGHNSILESGALSEYTHILKASLDRRRRLLRGDES